MSNHSTSALVAVILYRESQYICPCGCDAVLRIAVILYYYYYYFFFYYFYYYIYYYFYHPTTASSITTTIYHLPYPVLLGKQLTVTVQMLAHRAAAVRLCHQDSQMPASAAMTSIVVTVYRESLHF